MSGYEIPIDPAGERLWIPSVVRFTRFCRRRFDTDNSTASMKHIRDAVAKTLGTHDGPGGPIEWRYEPDKLAELPAVKVELLDFRWIPAPRRPEQTGASSPSCRPMRGNQVLRRPGRKLKAKG